MNERATETPGLTLTSYGGRTFRFDPGALCLELQTTGGPGEFARYEVLHEPVDLVAWTARSRLPDDLDITVTEGELERVRALRDVVFQLAADRAHGRPLRAAHLDVVNAAAAGPPLVARIEPDGTRAWAPGATGAHLLSTIARDAIDLFTGPYAHRVRECGAHNCYLLFVDTSRPGRRRWCAMEHCGNREKARAHRARAFPRKP
ncbi:CGNR zinc finger domain-containing protein [Streptomyces coeruleorubidus]|uniref:CGNR zinc finger domain-containing protein n=1 Tax=Streptomyces coeruleorubidus TaxID=116188 RepID=UPI00237F9820|nr:CGNR zinc finger domain-containing protein [Streptomyces coeruleorubidus]WDV53784.1 CGNR zinc finger domain-containing protein [Streptomyces coeruleorubidus]